MVDTSLLNRFKIRPVRQTGVGFGARCNNNSTTGDVGLPADVLSKNSIGAASTAARSDWCSLRAATKPANAKLKARARVNTLLTAAITSSTCRYHHTSLCQT